MKLISSTRRQKSGYIVIILAIIVLILAFTTIWVIARKLTQILPAGSKTNTVEYYYQTNPASQNLPQTPIVHIETQPVADSEGVEGSGAFTFFYGVHGSNGWVSVATNLTVTAPGTCNELENDSNRCVVAFNTGTNSVTMAYDANTGTELYEVTNQPVTVTICKSTNLTSWEVLWTDTNCVPDTVQSYTDSNAVEPEAFYKVK